MSIVQREVVLSDAVPSQLVPSRPVPSRPVPSTLVLSDSGGSTWWADGSAHSPQPSCCPHPGPLVSGVSSTGRCAGGGGVAPRSRSDPIRLSYSVSSAGSCSTIYLSEGSTSSSYRFLLDSVILRFALVRRRGRWGAVVKLDCPREVVSTRRASDQTRNRACDFGQARGFRNNNRAAH